MCCVIKCHSCTNAWTRALLTRNDRGSGTKLGKVSPIGRLFTLTSFYFKITTLGHIFGPLFPQCLGYTLILAKMDWAAFWSILWQTRLVTLDGGNISYCSWCFNFQRMGQLGINWFVQGHLVVATKEDLTTTLAPGTDVLILKIISPPKLVFENTNFSPKK
jgi:hypothetical protein